MFSTCTYYNFIVLTGVATQAIIREFAWQIQNVSQRERNQYTIFVNTIHIHQSKFAELRLQNDLFNDSSNTTIG